MWRLVKDGHVAEARVRPIEGIGVELRFLRNGEMRWSQVFKTWEGLEAAADEKRRELEARLGVGGDAVIVKSPTGTESILRERPMLSSDVEAALV